MSALGAHPGDARDDRLGWRPTSAVAGDLGHEVNLDASRREAAILLGPSGVGKTHMDEALGRASGPRQMDAALWRRLEEQRSYWALLMLRTAHVLKAAADTDWRSFAATAAALLEGRALRKVPIMDYILSASIAAWQVEEYGIAMGIPDDGVWPGSE